MKIAIVLPTFNEQSNISKLVPELFEVCQKNKINLSIIIVDDNSPDGTAEKAIELSKKYSIILIKRPKKMGLGSAYIAGFKRALKEGFELIFTMDADFSHQPRSLPAFVEESKKFDVVLGSRYIPGGGTSLTGYRFLTSKGANFLASILLGLKAKDMTTGYRCYHAKVLKTIGLDSIKTTGYSFLEEILFMCKNNGFSIGETPIFFDFRRGGESKLDKKEIINFFINMLRLKAGSFIGKNSKKK